MSGKWEFLIGQWKIKSDMLIALTLNIFISAFLVFISGSKIGRNGSCILILIYNIISIIIIIFHFLNQPVLFADIHYNFYNEKNLGINFEWGFSLDIISLFFMFIILFITTSILFFACSYMYVDPRFTFFLSFLQFFMFFMLILVLSKNIIQLFIGWEGVGVVSFLLINFWFLRLNANKSALKALIFNRIGDFGYMAFIVVCLVIFQTTTINLMPLLLVQNFFLENITIIVMFLFLAIFGKSAQLFLYAWLPDAMEGPTPVSALLHSATMVTAGVYLFLRLSDIIYNSSIIWIYCIIIIGGITSIFCGIYALVKFDIKKIIAFSTCSQLGLMFCTIAAGFIFPAFYHLFIHAFFKALLFISSGIIIHALADEQDIRKYGINSLYLPFYHLALLIGSINIMGIFFVSGFYSKEMLLLSSISSMSYILKSFILISSLFTIMYSIRLFLYSNTTISNIRSLLQKNQNLDGFLLYAICSLSFMSIYVGYFFVDSFNGLGANGIFLLNIPYNTITFELVSNCIIFLFPLFTLIFLMFYSIKIKFISYNNYILNLAINFSIKEFYIQSIYWVCNSLFNYIVYKYIIQVNERGVLDNCSLLGLIKLSFNLRKNLSFFFKNNVLALILGVFFLFVCSILSVLFLSFLNFNLFLLYVSLIFVISFNEAKTQ